MWGEGWFSFKESTASAGSVGISETNVTSLILSMEEAGEYVSGGVLRSSGSDGNQ